MNKQSFYRYINAYNHYKNDNHTFNKFYEFPLQYTNYDDFEKQKFLERSKALCVDSNSATKFYISQNVTNFLVNQHKFLFKWIQDKPIIFPYNPFCLQLEFNNSVAHLFFIESKGGKWVTISYYKDDMTLFNSTLYEIKGTNFDLKNLHIGIDDTNINIDTYYDNYERDRYNIWQCYMIFYMAIYEKQIFYVHPNKNKKEKKLLRNSNINYADYQVIKIQKEIYDNFLKQNKNKTKDDRKWHMVMSHLRQLQSGKITTVKSHSRGSKKIGVVLKDYEIKEGQTSK